MKLTFLIPSFNQRPWPETFVQRFNLAVNELKSSMDLKVGLVWIDDGSQNTEALLENHRSTLQRLNLDYCFAGRHSINRGQGAALTTALVIARDKLKSDYFVTFDSDGQHRPEDVLGLLKYLLKHELNIVYGNRFDASKMKLQQFPASRKMILRIATWFEFVITGVRLSDAHNGFRIFDKVAAEKLKLKQDRMAHATEIKLLTRKHKLKYGECPVVVEYSKELLESGQGNLNALNILIEIILGRIFG